MKRFRIGQYTVLFVLAPLQLYFFFYLLFEFIGRGLIVCTILDVIFDLFFAFAELKYCVDDMANIYSEEGRSIDEYTFDAIAKGIIYGAGINFFMLAIDNAFFGY